MRVFARVLILFALLSSWLVVDIDLNGNLALAQIGQEIVLTEESEVSAGNIIIRRRSTGQFALASTPSSSEIFGVIVDQPIMSFRGSAGEGVAILQTGQVSVNISTLNGPIEAGDYVTTSVLAGYGQKAGSEHQYILGVALESFSRSGQNISVAGEEVVVGQILIDLDIRPQVLPAELRSEENLPIAGDGVKTIVSGQIEHYSATIVRYFMAVLVALGSFYLSYRFFQSNVSGGLPALGRNPLAQKPIRQMLLLHIFIMVLISAAGLGLSVFILILPLIFI